MIRMKAVFGCGDSLTPDVAARIAQLAERHTARLQLECGGKRVLLGSLIGILALDCRRGSILTVIADGGDEQAAAAAIREVLEGK